MNNKWLCFVLLFVAIPLAQFAQSTFPTNGANNPQVTRYTFINANIQVSPDKFIAKGVLEINDGKIVAVKNKGEKYDTTTIVIDLEGKYVYPSFIDIYSGYGLPKAAKKKKIKGVRDKTVPPQYTSKTKGAFGWNEAIKPETSAAYLFAHNKKAADSLMALGFGSVATFVHDGIARGTSVFINLNPESENKSIITEQASANFSFKKGSSKQVYPTSLMGSMALLRQTFYDAEAYKGGFFEEKNLSLEAFNKQQSLPLVFQADNKWDILRIQDIAKEFGKEFIIKTTGDEYQIIEELKNYKLKLIVPLNFPNPIHVETVFDEAKTNYTDLKHAEMAMYNPVVLNQNNIAFALTGHGFKGKNFLKVIREIVAKGLSEEATLSALTKTPASYINASDKLGTLEKGKFANFIITDGKLFNKGTTVLENWNQGKQHVINYPNNQGIVGDHQILYIDGEELADLEIFYKKGKLDIKASGSTNKVSKVFYNKEKQTFSFVLKTTENEFKLTGWNVNWQTNKGVGSDEKGKTVYWYTENESAINSVSDKEPEKENMPELKGLPYIYAKKDSNTFMVRRATIWTNEKEGVLINSDVLVVNGKVVEVGEVSPETLNKYGIKDSRDIPVINGTGKHLTAGIVDEHSHIAIMGGVNESSESSTAEVRIGDVINPEDINIYRQLAGGVTTSQLLHGSANVIGGQSAVVKLKWGSTPGEMKFKEAPGRIKFALGENVKQSNWGEKFTVRFPQTRMGVEQVFEDYFTRAKEYEKAWEDYKKKKTKKQPRKNLELEALLEVVNGKRLVSCHSYSQQEINMLMKVAEKYGFKINIFTHVLEGYKIADKLKAHGAGASTFSDWWGYKYEVIEASAYNAALLNEAGVTTCINSDDAEMGRRLNQEAAKAVKYGGVSEEDALKMITLNPAKLMGIDNRVGSIKVGKDADLVLWNGHPLSIYSTPVTTYIEGVAYFDTRRHKQAEQEILTEKKELIKKMNEAIAKGKKGKEPNKKKEKLYHCDDEEIYGEEVNND
jgi:imidazolonepropionase-like amidohydrolase